MTIEQAQGQFDEGASAGASTARDTARLDWLEGRLRQGCKNITMQPYGEGRIVLFVKPRQTITADNLRGAIDAAMPGWSV